jgi:two-component system, OmpR family, KDP operon response regulator KdpE
MERGPRVLVLDDDVAMRRLLRRQLTTACYRVQDVAASQTVLKRITEREFDLLILDMDSTATGCQGAIRIVRDVSSIPILALSVRRDEEALVDALNSGADDYVQKPFGSKELLARVRNALRRRARQRGKPDRIVTAEFELDLAYRRVHVRGSEVHLPRKHYEVLRVLAEGAGRVLTHKQILRAVWGSGRPHQIGYLRLAIRELRRKLEVDPAHPRYILTEIGVGYRLETQRLSKLAGKGDSARS